ncbi:Type III secretion inner membrane protein [Paraburkholderia caribensis MBA4]|uniref:Type III secretion inner membrane protein n=1 Tax=Paraburkholderia caribensis MBA4 TaxID=1323664 RepID=A0A0P0RD87_9BURK|nr:FliM/FliN family flagellar motor switch protein [Paraburkholderia caribensis]ALL66361.1 Type III secretion inner membrane protein [Paraburkholderia caribensis MBA4]
MERISASHAERHNVAALHFGTAYPISVGKRAYTLQFELRRERYPLRLHAQAAGQVLLIDCDAQALFPELNRQTLAQAGESAPSLFADAFEEWLSALEGLFGFALNLTDVSFDAQPSRGAYGLVLTHVRTHRAAHFALESAAVDAWLKRQRVSAGELARYGRRLVLPVSVCMEGPALTLQRLRRIRPGDALLLNRSSQYLRLPLRHGARRILLQSSGEHMVIDRPMIDDANASSEMTSELIPTSALMFSFDAVIGTLSLTLDELAHLRTGSIVSLRLPLNRHAVVLLCQGIPFARGELIEIDDALGVRIVDMTHMADTATSS